MTRIENAASSSLARRLRAACEGEVLFDAFSRGRYGTDASIYQVVPLGVVVPKTMEDVRAVMAICREQGVAVLPRGGGTSQCGQTVNDAVVLDLSKHLNAIVEVDPDARTAVVEPGLVLDHLNAALKEHGLWYPVDVSTSSRATLGGMTANNSCGGRSRRYGTSRDNVLAIDAILADGTSMRFGELARGTNASPLFSDLLALGEREAVEIAERFPNVDRRVGGYNLDALVPNGPVNNLAHLLVGSEGTLAFSERITLKLSPVIRSKVLGVCHFPSFREAMDAAQHLVTLDPIAIELVDSTMIGLARDIPMFRPVLEEFVRGEPAALLIVEFGEEDQVENLHRLKGLHDLMAALGFRWGDPGKKPGGVVEAVDTGLQGRIAEVRKQGLNIMMSMKSEGKPVSFVEDCCVRLPDLADYTDRLTAIFRKHGTDGTWYAHASVGTLHVRPVLNLKQDTGVRALRAIAEEAFELVRDYRGSHSGEHGDGIVRSEFHETMFGERIVRAFGEVKDRMDPGGLFNPGRIVRPPRMDDRSLMRFAPDYAVPEIETVFSYEGHHGAGRGLQGAVEMCNNNGACRKLGDGVMCPSYRVTRSERDVVRGRANTLRLALSGQLGRDALSSDAMAETMKLCVGCKACRRECPTGVDMAKMKIEAAHARAQRNGLTVRDRLVGLMPRYAPFVSRVAWLANLRNRSPWLSRLMERWTGLSAERPLPEWSDDPYRPGDRLDRIDASTGRILPPPAMADADVILFADSFNRWFEPDNLRAAEIVLTRAGLRVAVAEALEGGQPLCCGRTFLSAGMAADAKFEMLRTADALRPALERGVPVVGLEPSCILTFRDEAPALLGRELWPEAFDRRVMLLEEFVAERAADGRFDLPLAPLDKNTALLHGHCHQKAFNVMGPVQKVLRMIPGLTVEPIASSCCGMAGAFGYQSETLEISRAMGELSLMPRVRAAGPDAILVADGTSCRHQIADLAGREAMHVACVLLAASDAAMAEAVR